MAEFCGIRRSYVASIPPASHRGHESLTDAHKQLKPELIRHIMVQPMRTGCV
ncbi:hypothetical protein IG631_19085 [Alternaria alternata]|nr:hypothetical protein IG631_19085 [Alternaria alternata]